MTKFRWKVKSQTLLYEIHLQVQIAIRIDLGSLKFYIDLLNIKPFFLVIGYC